jgi:hypothetical protein
MMSTPKSHEDFNYSLKGAGKVLFHVTSVEQAKATDSKVT